MNLVIILLLLTWYLSGIISFIYWWTTEHDYGGPELLMSLLIGLAGPVAFVMGYIVHGKGKVLIKRRNSA